MQLGGKQSELYVSPEDKLGGHNARTLPRFSAVKLGGVVGAVGLLVLGFWYVTLPKKEYIHDSLPVIKAPEGPSKIKPEKDQISDVPHGEKTIYNNLNQTAQLPTTEHLLEEPEEPQAPPPSLPEEFLSEFMQEEMAAPSPEKTVEPTSTEPSASAKVEEAAKPMPPVAQDKAPAATPPAQSQAMAEKTTPTPTQKNVWIQVAAMKTQEAADREWARLTAHTRMKPLLHPYGSKIKRVDLGADKGIRYRVLIGPMASADAKALLQKLKVYNVDGLIKKS